MTSLNGSTTYYVRAYATNSAGTSYGSQVSFETESAGWGNIAKVGGVTATDIAKVDGVAVADIAKVNGVAV